MTPTRRWSLAIATLPLAGGGSNQLHPPFRCDALRPLGLHHAAGHAPPGEAHGWPFGNLGKHDDRLGLGKEKNWPRGFARALLGPERIPCQSGERVLRPLRNVAGVKDEPAHSASAQPARQAIDQRLLTFSAFALGKGGLGREQWLGREC